MCVFHTVQYLPGSSLQAQVFFIPVPGLPPLRSPVLAPAEGLAGPSVFAVDAALELAASVVAAEPVAVDAPHPSSAYLAPEGHFVFGPSVGYASCP